MGIGLGVVLLVIGLILVTGAISLPQGIENSIQSEPLGWIFIIAAVISVGLSLAMNRQRSKSTHVEERRYER